jgi:hypothetical protein
MTVLDRCCELRRMAFAHALALGKFLHWKTLRRAG